MNDYIWLKRVTKTILALIFGQAFVERGFNVNKNFLQQDLEGLSLASQRLIYDYLVTNDLTTELITVSKGLRDSVKKPTVGKGFIMNTEKKKKSLTRKSEKLMR